MIRYTFLDEIPVIFLDRPHRAHAYTPEMLTDLSKAISLSEEHSVCIISSTGEKHFCSGADMDSLQVRKAEDGLRLSSQRIFDQIAISSTIFIGAIQGPAIAGGFELALACDLRVAHPQAYFSLPEVSLGLIPSAGGCTRLARLLGESIAKGVVLGGQKIDAVSAERWGLVHKISSEPLETAKLWAEEIKQKNRLALHVAKTVLNNPSLQAERLGESILYERKSRNP